MNLKDKIQTINKSFEGDKKNFKSGLIKFDDLKNKYLGRKGLLSELYPLLNTISSVVLCTDPIFLIAVFCGSVIQ